ncbi:MAG TPA: 16S rRNA (guanine(966)-N(2))-methyltransferase RsmD [Oculatellaceae cyanobacterium]
MRITGGQARGRTVTSPAGLTVRPTASKVRQALFNILGARVTGANFLDVFAGSGLIGLEALSRGAQSLVSIEENRKMARAIEQSLEQLQFSGIVYCSDFRQVLSKLQPASFDIIFADPPYKTPFGRMVVEKVDTLNLLSAGGVFVLEHLRDYELPANLGGLNAVDTRQYGQTCLTFYLASKES